MQLIMLATSRIILALASTVIIAATSVDKNSKTNFQKCQENYYALADMPCHGYIVDAMLKRCVNNDNVQFYCASSSPIQVIIGQLDHSREPATAFYETLNVESFASSGNGSHAYCVDIAAKVSADYFVKCRSNSIKRPKAKWIPFTSSNPREDSVRSLEYINVNKTNGTEICDSMRSLQYTKDPILLPCDTWQVCAIEIAKRYKDQTQINVTLIDASMTDIDFLNCKYGWQLRQSLKSEKFFQKPGLLAFRGHHHNEFLLPYRTSETLMAFELKTTQLATKFRIECQSSVLHSCGLELVVNNFRIESSDGDCHMHHMVVELIPGLKGTITCSAFNEFQGSWNNETAYFAKNNTRMRNEKNPSETQDGANKNLIISNENKTTEIPYHAKENTTASPDDDDDNDPIGAIVVGAVLGGICLCFLVLLPLLICLYKRIRLQNRRIRLTQDEICEFMEGMQKEKAESRGIHNVFVLPYDRSLEVPKIAVDFKTTVLGSGAFGKVLKGRYQGQDVAIKTIDGTTLNADAFRSLLSELKIMSYLGKHEHVMELVGAITSDIKTGEVFLILEYCAHGSAISYIREHREDFVSFLSDDKTMYIQNPSIAIIDSISELTSHHLVRWSYEVACGMEYVSSRNIYHGDLAARNILLTENLTAKVGDFGLSKQLDREKYACYVQKKDCPLPLKWMAIESLRDLKFSIQSDVWSFGVTLWEFFSLGTIPYPGIEWNNESWKSLCEGVRLDRPEFASMRIYNNIMRKCWSEEPKDRPAFSALKALLKDELEGFNSVETCKVATLRNKYEKVTKRASNAVI